LVGFLRVQLIRLQALRQTGQPPARHRRNHRDQRYRTCPVTCSQPNSDRNAQTISFADPTARPGQLASTNAMTSAAVKLANSSVSPLIRLATNPRTQST
jgi:hypothetical protein